MRNVLVNSLSRNSAQQTEWSLNRRSFQEVQAVLLGLQIDQFASKENHKLPCFVTPYLHKKAVATNAMFLDWNRWGMIYLFPPVNIPMKMLNKLRDFKGRAILVAPL